MSFAQPKSAKKKLVDLSMVTPSKSLKAKSTRSKSANKSRTPNIGTKSRYSSSSKLNRSVTFNSKVKVREF